MIIEVFGLSRERFIYKSYIYNLDFKALQFNTFLEYLSM